MGARIRVSLRLVEAAEAKINVKMSYSQWWPRSDLDLNQGFHMFASPSVLLPLSHPTIPYKTEKLS